MNILSVFSNAKTAVTTLGGRTMLKIEKYSPEISIGFGLVVGGLAIASSIVATLKIETILDERDQKLSDISDGVENPGLSYTEEDAEEDRKKLRIRTVLNITKLYLPTIGLTLASGGLIVMGFTKMKARYLGAVSLYNGLSAAFTEYRGRVKEKIGEEEEQKIYLGEDTKEVKKVDEKGKMTLDQKQVFNGVQVSPYSIVFERYLRTGQKNIEWDENINFNKMFLKARENMANDLLQKRGHVFLNEVYDSIGQPHTKEGALVGWVKGQGDNCIDFGLLLNERSSVKDYFKGKGEPSSLLLDFNVDGVIFDKI